MATLTRTRPASADFLSTSHQSHALSLDIPKPFPTRAELEQAELLESLALEDLQLDELNQPTPGPSTIPAHVDDVRTSEGEILPSILHLQSSCLTTLNDLLSSASDEDDHQHLFISSSKNQNQVSDSVDDTTLLQSLKVRVDRVSPALSPRDADLAHSLLTLLTHFYTLTSLHSSSSTTPPLSRTVSSTVNLSSPSASSSSNPISHLRRHLSDFQLERLARGDSDVPTGPKTPVLTVQTAVLWTQIDEQLETILSLSRSSFDDAASSNLPPQYDPAGYEEEYDVEGLPKYDPGDYQSIRRSKSLDHSSEGVSPTMSFASTNEKMKMDLEAVTLAIDRLYQVAPQLHNQRVELKKTKLEQMEKARREGKQVDGRADERELERVLELIGKAAERKIPDQAVVLNESMKARMARAQERESAKRTAFVEHLVMHSGAGRMDSQDASFPVSPAPRSAAAAKMQDPEALLTLPEFIREAVPQAVSERMHMNERITLPEFVKEAVPEHFARSAKHSRIQSVSTTAKNSPSPPPDPAPTESVPLTRTSSKTSVKKGLRNRSLSAPPLAWLLSKERAASPAKPPKTTRPGSSHGRLPSLQAGLDVSYVAEHHENLQHIIVFLTISGLAPNIPAEAEVLTPDTVDELPHLIIRNGVNSSQQLDLPAHVTPGKKDLRMVGDNHYEVKLHTSSSSRPQSRLGSSPTPSTDIDSPAIMDATYFSTTAPTSLVCTSCSLPLVQASRVQSYRDLPSEHWAELVDAWMCHPDMKLHEHVKKGSKDGFWPRQGEVLVGGSYVLVREDTVVKSNLCETRKSDKTDDWTRVRCMCGAVVGRCQDHTPEDGPSVNVYRLIKYAFRPVSPNTEPVRVPLSAFIVEDMVEFVQAHATYRFIIMDDEEDRPRILVWLFKPNMRLSYATASPYTIPKSGSIRTAKILFKLLGPSTAPLDLSSILDKYPGFPQAEHLYYPIDICRRIASLLKESNNAYPESMRTMTGLDVGWLQRA